MDAIDALVTHGMRAKALEQAAVGAFQQQMVVERAKDRSEGVGVEEAPGGMGVFGAQAIQGRAGRVGACRFQSPGRARG